TELTHELLQLGAIDRAYLGNVCYAGTWKTGFTFPQAYVSWHRCQAQARGNRSNYGRADGAAVEAIMLHHEGRALAVRFRALAKPKPVDLSMQDHQRSSVQSLPSSSNCATPRRCSSAVASLANISLRRRVTSASRRAFM